jgi:putative ABC transport system substrate-binding protein
MAARRAGAADGDASHRLHAYPLARGSSGLPGRVHQGLKEAGYVEGQNVAVEYRWARGHYDRLPEFAADLVRRKVAVIAATGGDPSPQVAKAATQTIPIVFAMNGDPVKEGLVDSLSRPGGNATGITIFGPAVATKRLQLLHELVPHAAVVGFLMNPNNPNGNIEAAATQAVASSLGVEILILEASSESELDAAFASMTRHQVGALLGASDAFLAGRRDQIVALAAQQRIPAIYYLREFSEAGGLISYGNRIPDAYHQVGIYVGRILMGDKPRDLPVQESVKFELLINLKTAKTLGLPIPDKLLATQCIWPHSCPQDPYGSPRSSENVGSWSLTSLAVAMSAVCSGFRKRTAPLSAVRWSCGYAARSRLGP